MEIKWVPRRRSRFPCPKNENPHKSLINNLGQLYPARGCRFPRRGKPQPHRVGRKKTASKSVRQHVVKISTPKKGHPPLGGLIRRRRKVPHTMTDGFPSCRNSSVVLRDAFRRRRNSTAARGASSNAVENSPHHDGRSSTPSNVVRCAVGRFPMSWKQHPHRGDLIRRRKNASARCRTDF